MEKDNEIKNKIVETYAEDMAKIIENDKEGLIKKIIHGEEEHEKEKSNLSVESKKNKFFIFAGSLFFLVALGTFSYFFFSKDISTLEIEKQFTPIIFNDKNVFIDVKDLSKEKIAQTVLNKVNETGVKNGEIEGIYLSSDKKVIGVRQFLTLLESSFAPDVPGEFTFVYDNFLMGVVNGETKDFFILLKVRSSADVFDSLRAWENKMFTDLHGFFGIDISSETKYLLTAEFQNGIVENKNANILYDMNGGIVMMYIFADENSIIITNTENAAREIMLRLASSRVKK